MFFFSTSQFYSVNSLYIRILTSLTKSVKFKRNLTFSHIFSKSALQKYIKIKKIINSAIA